MRTSSLDSFHDVVESPDAGSVGIDVGITHKLVNHPLVSPPVIRKTTKMGNDEIHVGVLRCKHVHNFRPSYYIRQYGHLENSRRFADLPSRHGLKAMQLYATEYPFAC